MFATSDDGARIHYEVTGADRGDTALLFVHGWMGNLRWWDAQRDVFAGAYRVIAMDLAGHGASSRSRPAWSAEAYANDIVAVAREAAAPRLVIVAHSMSGAYALVAAPELDGVAALVLVDTLKNLDVLPAPDQVAAMLASYRADYPAAIENLLPRYLFAARTPPEVAERLTREFLTVSGDIAATLIEPLYRFDVRAAARRVRVPVRGIGGDVPPEALAANRGYFADYAYTAISGFGHYPMLEASELFNAALAGHLAELPGTPVR